MSNTTLLDLPLLEAAQAQKHVTHNEALQVLDILTMPAVSDKDLATPPSSPAEGDRYIVAASATGDWAGQEASIAAYQDSIWRFFAPRAGWAVWVADEASFYVFNGTAWTSDPGSEYVTSTELANGSVSQLGINASSDTYNRLSVNSDSVLFNNNGSSARVVVNKSTSGDTASHLFQTNWSGRAEFGLTGSDDFQVKVSPDGSSWKNTLSVDRSTGIVTFHQGFVDASRTAARINQAHAWFHILTNAAQSVLSIADGIVDAFVDETGVDTGASSNQTYNSSGDYYSSATNMTLLSNTATAGAQPDSVHAILQHEPVDSVTLNTDCTIEVSIDGGSTWAAGTLELVSSNGGINILSADDIDVSGQTGTSVKYRFKTLNSKNQKLHAVALNWR